MEFEESSKKCIMINRCFPVTAGCYFIILFCLNLFSTAGFSQQFEVAPGPISNTTSDSRSVNFFDVNNDGWEDIYISNGKNGGQKDFLYLNDGNGGMEPVTGMEIVELSNPSDGASFADYNNDGYTDGMISSWHGAEDVLCLNDGNGQLNYNAAAGIVSGSYSETAAFGDYNNDGWLDLYITNSASSDNNNFLYKNLKNGKFERIENHTIVSDKKLSRGAIWCDYNNDNLLDLFIANENNTVNDLYRGVGDGNFEKVTEGSIVTEATGSMTASWADIDNDGDIDLFVGNAGYFQTQRNHLFLNTESGFEKIETGPLVEKLNCTYGSAFADYDNDGDQDLIVANGYCNSGLANNLYENDGQGNFENVSALLPENNQVCSFGAAWGDVNNDGFPDLMIANCKNNTTSLEKANQLLINKSNENNWLKIKLTGTASNKEGIGARIRIKAMINGQEVWQLREVSAQSGYAGQNSRIAHFGLGDATAVDSMEVIWPAGGRQFLTSINCNQQILVVESLPNALASTPAFNNYSMRIFPNPSNRGQINLQIYFPEISAQQSAELMIYDSIGQLKMKKEVQLKGNPSVLPIAMSKQKFTNGAYFFVLQVGDYMLREKLIVQ